MTEPPDQGRAVDAVIERFVAARHPDQPSADVIVVGDHVIGVVDGSTPKPWEEPGPTGVDVAAAVADVLRTAHADTTLPDSVAAATAAVAALGELHLRPVAERPCATFAAIHLTRREVWRVGGDQVLIGSRFVPSTGAGEADVAERRAAVLREHLAAGASVDELRADDRGRAAVMPSLRELAGRRNLPDGDGYGAIDGDGVPDRYLEVIPVPDEVGEVVLGTDGYPDLRPTLAGSESALAARLEEDPLLIACPPATKGLTPGADSFDDRAYVRVRLDVTGGGS